jgi:hypothetical protein
MEVHMEPTNQQLLEIDEPATPRSRRRGILAVIAGAAVMVAAIGVPTVIAAGPGAALSGPTIVTAVTGGSAQADAAFAKFAACMREHGIDMPDPVKVDAVPAAGGAAPNIVSLPATVHVSGGALVGGTAASVPDKDFQAANEACSPILEGAGIHAGTGTLNVSGGTVVGGPGSGAGVGIGVIGGGDVTKQAASMKAYAACMRTHGVDVPDPVVDTKAGSVQMSFPGDPASETFRAADAACAVDGFSFAPPVAPAP